ncbi:MAG: type I DNA topoisomerase [bacterium]|nr:type I DNA topoisomerase [bacterium]
MPSIKKDKTLVIVESPTKAKTIAKFLGSKYIVESSMGHVRNLPKSKIGIDIENNFKPLYEVSSKSKDTVKELKKAVKESSSVILASDEDREGEAIAWHLMEALKLNKEDTKRIVFHEITKSAIEEALQNPREVNYDLVNAQQARRVLDRLVGYELSPFLWRKIRYGLSAGRVQSVAVRLIVEREREIQAFKKDEYWTIETDFLKEKDPKEFHAKLAKVNSKTLSKLQIGSDTAAKDIVDELKGTSYKVTDVVRKEAKRHPSPPFTTSTLQQEASRKLGMSAKQTMMFAQKLYETGLITYMRTDSVNMADSALKQAKQVLSDTYGKEYTLSEPRRFTAKSKGAQEAHEAIRPSDFSKMPETADMETAPKKLYALIWKRAIATQMPVAIFDKTAVDITSGKYMFRANGSIIKFDGFIKVYLEGTDDQQDEDAEGQLPDLSVGDSIISKAIIPLQHFTEPPPRYTDATLVKALEANGIGRPSTFAPTLSTIQERDYVEKEEKRYKPTEIGTLVNDMLVEHFPEIVNINFTSHIEEELDEVADGKLSWTAVIKEFYVPFKKNLASKEDQVEKVMEISDVECEHCQKMMLMKYGRNGKFLACPDPDSKITKPMPEEEEMIKCLTEKTKGEMCPICGLQMNVRRGRFGYFLGCANYPKCKGIAKIVTRIGFACPNCEKGDMIERKSRGRGALFYGCSNYPDCNFLTGKLPGNEEELNEMLEEWKKKPKKK